MIRKYFRVWWLMTTRVSQTAFASRIGAATFILAKILRFGFFLLFLLLIFTKTKAIASYSVWEVILFFATFNLVDTLSQLFLREVYRFRSYVVSGDFDYFLTKPISPLFRSLFGGGDVLDVPILLISLAFLALSFSRLEVAGVLSVFLYILLVANALSLALSFHIAVLAVGILTTEVDNTLWIYRDLTQMGRVPIDVYRQPIRAILTFVLPVGIMMTFPPKALLGLLSYQAVIMSFSVSLLFLLLSLKFWQYALRHYASASS